MQRRAWLVIVGVAAIASVAIATTIKSSSTRDCPAEMVRVPAGSALSGYCIDRTEVTVAAYAQCVAAKGCQPAPLTVNASWSKGDEAVAWSRFCDGERDDLGDHPVNCVDWNNAATFCEWAGKRLPTEAEWEHAARGNDGRMYPWGDAPPSAELLNVCGGECVALVSRVLAQAWIGMYTGDDGAASTAPVGSYPAGASPFGVLDMAGNVWEWVADRRGDAHVYKGGGWLTTDIENVRASNRKLDTAALRLNTLGFRCARSFSP